MTDIMTEDVQVPTSMSEYNGNVSPEKPQLQVIDIIDQIANSVEIFPYDSAASQPALLLTQESQGGVGHLVENSVYEACDISTYEDTIGMKEHQGKPEGFKEKNTGSFAQERRDWEEESGEELCQESHPTSSREQDIPEEEEWDAELCQGENIDDMAEEEQEEKKEAQLSESTEKIKEGEQSKASEKTAVKDAVGTGGGGVLKTNNEDSHKKGQENNSKEFRPIHPSCNAQTEKPDELTGTLRKNDISRHSYSRYNTISYRKIRKGNTKQRIDEFESMMHS
ncbi:ermin isoform X1 [Anolis carolinensis]|uniref:Ermin n=1 Tax=Anolis carolinensis TaxID=28377 RepID=H9GD16_ANOCA|nr:PREDICTED: ermin isoform X1 [Anolis carolinensis]|eukprot:XP_003224650.1 PREDICTED: ermin isoform X1 [Anolis carolinensis]